MQFARTFFETGSIRARIALAMIVPVLPVAAMVVLLLAEDLRHAREAAHAEVRLLATTAADDLNRFLQRWGEALQRIASRPQVREMSSAGCDPLLAEVKQLIPGLEHLGLRSATGAVVCSTATDPLARWPIAGTPWFRAALASEGLRVSDAIAVGATPQWVSVLTYPVRDEAGRVVGVLTLPLDLIEASKHWLAGVPSTALVAVLDGQRAVLMRSTGAAGFVGQKPRRHAVDPPGGAREGFLQVTGDDGVSRLLAFVMLPGLDWRVIAARPRAEVFADFDVTVQRTATIGIVVVLVGVWLGLRLSAGIARPITGLAETARAVARGDTRARAVAAGPSEVVTVAGQLNLMLDARDAAEAALRESEERYRTLVEWSPEALSVHRGGVVLFANRATVELLAAKSADELVGQRSIEVVHPAFREGIDDVVNAALEQGSAVPRHEEQFVRRDGRVIDVEVQGTRIVLNGEPALIASLRDITERKQSQAALQASEARLQAIFATAHDAILTVDSAQNVVLANPAAAAMFRCPLEQLIGAPIERLIPERFRRGHDAEFRAFGRGEGGPILHVDGRRRPVIGRRADGEEFAIDAAISRLEVGGRRFFTVIMRDMTERRRFEATLREREAQLRRLFAAQDRVQEEERRRIARELHDDLQQTLAAMRMNLKAVGERISADPRGAAALLAEVDQLAGAAIVSTRRIVNDLRPPILEDLGLVPALETLAAQFRQHSGIACEVLAAHDGGGDIESPAVATSLFRVAQESLNNVLKHARATRVTMRLADAPGGRVSLTIQDDGVGFEPGAARKPLSYGLLGMNERIRALGGVLRIESRPGVGTTIEVTLPAHGGAPPSGPVPMEGSGEPEGFEAGAPTHGSNDATAGGAEGRAAGVSATGGAPPASQRTEA